MALSNVYYSIGDLPNDFIPTKEIAFDTETMGLRLWRDRLCAFQLSNGDGKAYVVRFEKDCYDAPNIKRVLSDDSIVKVFQYARFDLAAILHYLGVNCKNIYCTKIASQIARTNAESHGLKALCKEFAGVELEKEMQRSDWGALEYTEKQLQYAAADVMYLHKIKRGLENILIREGRKELATRCFEFLPSRALLDVLGWHDVDIFAH